MLAFFLAGPSAAEKLDIVVPPPVTVAALAAGSNPQPIGLAKIVVDMREGEAWLDLREGYLCIPRKSAGWKATSDDLSGDPRLGPIFADTLEGAGFKVGAKDKSDLFGTSTRSVDMQIGARIGGIRAKVCFMSFDNLDVTSASVIMDVEWQVYSVSQNKLLARIPTHGGRNAKVRNLEALKEGLNGAFAENVKALAVSDVFRTLVTSTPATVSPAALATSGEIRVSMPAARPMPLADAAKGVVSVIVGGGHGSGFLISQDGYILTNHHVAGASGRVRVRWPDGTDSVGEVIRGDGRRDVALIKTTAKVAPLSVRHTPVKLGEPVFAIGTPMDSELAGTLTRGIVSAMRTFEGAPYIQSDVAVTGGNSGGPLLDEAGQVVGLTVSGRAENGVPVGLNFFIPIDDALRVLQLKPAP